MEPYVIVCLRHRDMYFGDNGFLFWGPDEKGYTAVIRTAGLYSEERAMKLFSEQDVPIPISLLGLTEADFIEVKSGFKELRQLTLLNVENKANQTMINVQREKFRQKISAEKTRRNCDMPKQPFITNFYANGKCVWRRESPDQLTDEAIKTEIAAIAEMGYGKVDAITDSSGRMVRYDGKE